ncbi:hypothetical protein OGAPHI_005970 [Ogataea philodendri]|uniref:Uncharacterized protein n=1 Tax=Ogataea philodendri TaxID=1378263 RepID=A0A9P8NYG7_9ASCO|nr:uncharacterized protein OGAPHI_005970 [Ogataea philodendri]KAH3661792.1 hypothetical protein OGAPHI_005970 [Ogataea philodendri]
MSLSSSSSLGPMEDSTVHLDRRENRGAVNGLVLLTSVLISFAIKNHLHVSLTNPFSVNLLILCSVGSLLYLYYQSLPLDSGRLAHKIGALLTKLGRVFSLVRLGILHIVMLILVVSALICNETRFLYFLLPLVIVWVVDMDPTEVQRGEISSVMELRLQDIETEINSLKLGFLRRQHTASIQDRSLEYGLEKLQQDWEIKLRNSNAQIVKLQAQIGDLKKQSVPTSNGWIYKGTKVVMKSIMSKNQINALRYVRQLLRESER